MTSSEYQHLLGVRDGFSHAIITVFAFRQSLTGPANAYLPPERHKKKRAAVEAKLADLDKVIDSLKRQHENVKFALDQEGQTND